MYVYNLADDSRNAQNCLQLSFDIGLESSWLLHMHIQRIHHFDFRMIGTRMMRSLGVWKSWNGSQCGSVQAHALDWIIDIRSKTCYLRSVYILRSITRLEFLSHKSSLQRKTAVTSWPIHRRQCTRCLDHIPVMGFSAANYPVTREKQPVLENKWILLLQLQGSYQG